MDKQIIQFLSSKKVGVIDEPISEKLEVWRQWYEGKVDSFHNYSIYNGKEKINHNRLSMNMAAQVCRRWADLLVNEKLEVNVADEATETVLEEILDSANFRVRANNLVELAFAIGGGFFIEYWDGKKPSVKYVSQEFMYPISYDSGELTEAAFASTRVIDSKEYTYVETHTLDEAGMYVVDNFILTDAMVEVEPEFYERHGLMQKWETGSSSPLFQQVRPNIADVQNFDSPFGQSVYSGATDILKACDIVFDSYYKEFLLGKKRIFVKDGISNIAVDKDGNQIDVFDPQDEVFYKLSDSYEETAPLSEVNGTLRIMEHETGLNSMLDRLSQACGFGSGGFIWNGAQATTATQVISANSTMFRTLKKHEALLGRAIVNACRGLLWIAATVGNGKDIDLSADVTVNFDDSIIEDTESIKRQALTDLQYGLIDDIEYYCTVYKMTEEQALDFRRRLIARRPELPVEPEVE